MTEALELSYKKRKITVLLGAAAMLLIVIIWALFIRARALSDLMTGYEDLRGYVADEIADGMMNSIDAIFDDKSTGVAESAHEVSVNEFFRGVKPRIENDKHINMTETAIMAVAMILVLIYSSIALFKELQRGDGGIDMWAKCFIVVTLSIVCVVNYQSIIGVAEGLGDYVMKEFLKIKDASSSGSALKEWISGGADSGSPFYIAGDLEDVGFMDFGDLFGNIFFTIKVWLMMFLLVIVLILMEIPLMSARIVLLTILIEIIVRKVFFPMAMASVCTGGMRSPGVAYIKKLLALYIRVAICILVAIICDVIVGNLMKYTQLDLLSGIMRSVCIFVIFSTCTKIFANTSSLANSIVGVH